jgi:hypothetical protein
MIPTNADLLAEIKQIKEQLAVLIDALGFEEVEEVDAPALTLDGDLAGRDRDPNEAL